MSQGVDHIVLPVENLVEARARYEQLGFSVNADGIHPFGTANCCVFFDNDTYLEPLAIHDHQIAKTMAVTNSFVALDQAYRKAMGNEGLSAIALQGLGVESDEENFRSKGFGGRNILSFKRKALHADGTEDVLSVTGAFCLHQDLASLGFFRINWLGDPQIISKIKKAPKHENGALGIVGITLASSNPENWLTYLETATGQAAEKGDAGRFLFTLPNGVLTVQHMSGNKNENHTDLRAISITLNCPSLSKMHDLLTRNNVNYAMVEDKIHIPSARGQGIAFQFSEESFKI